MRYGLQSPVRTQPVVARRTGSSSTEESNFEAVLFGRVLPWAGDHIYLVAVAIVALVVGLAAHLNYAGAAVLVLGLALWHGWKHHGRVPAFVGTRYWTDRRIMRRRFARALDLMWPHVMSADKTGDHPQLVYLETFEHGMVCQLQLHRGVAPDAISRLCPEIAHTMSNVRGVPPIISARVEADQPGYCKLRLFVTDPLDTAQAPALEDGTQAMAVLESGEPLWWEPARYPHILICGETGSGKTQYIMSLITALANSHDGGQTWSFCFMDPKIVTFGSVPVGGRVSGVATDPLEIAGLMARLVQEMDSRYRRMAAQGVQDYRQLTPRPKEGLIVIDELASLLTDKRAANREAVREIDDALGHLALKGRQCALWLCLGIQRPDASVMGGIVRDNVIARVGLRRLGRSGVGMLFGGADDDIGESARISEMFVDEPGTGVAWRCNGETQHPTRFRAFQVTEDEFKQALGVAHLPPRNPFADEPTPADAGGAALPLLPVHRC